MTRRTITGRVLRYAYSYVACDLLGREIHFVSACRGDGRNLVSATKRSLDLLLGLELRVRLLRLHGPRYLEHALLVGTERPEPGTKVPIESFDSFLRNEYLAEWERMLTRPFRPGGGVQL